MLSSDREAFLALPAEAIADLVRSRGKPRVGIFVPDGNRRLVLSTTTLPEDSAEFFSQIALTQTSLGLNTLKIFFSHGLPTLFVPLFSRSVLARESDYRHLTALKTLNIIFASDEWLHFYETWDVRLKVYGDLSVLAQTDYAQVRSWLEHAQQITQTHTAHTLFLGLGGEPVMGWDAAMAAARFYQAHQREPSSDELIECLYGQAVPPADFFIMSSKLAGLGAVPALICDANTQVYYLPVPGVLGLTQPTYRAILYDLLYLRERVRGGRSYTLTAAERERLRAWYAGHAEVVIGLGHSIGPIWLPAGLERQARFD